MSRIILRPFPAMSRHGCITVGPDFNIGWTPRIPKVGALFVYVSKTCDVVHTFIAPSAVVSPSTQNATVDLSDITRPDLDYYFLAGVVYGAYEKKYALYRLLPFIEEDSANLTKHDESVTAFIATKNSSTFMPYRAEGPSFHMKGRGAGMPGDSLWGIADLNSIGNSSHVVMHVG